MIGPISVQFLTILNFLPFKIFTFQVCISVRYRNSWTLSMGHFLKLWQRRENYPRNPPINLSEFWERYPRNAFGHITDVISRIIEDVCSLQMGWVMFNHVLPGKWKYVPVSIHHLFLAICLVTIRICTIATETHRSV